MTSEQRQLVTAALAARGAMCGLDDTNPDHDDPMIVGMWAVAEIGWDSAHDDGYPDTDAQQLGIAGRVADALMVLNFGQIDIR